MGEHHDPAPATRPLRRRQRGFALVIVFLILALMVGAAAALLLTTRTELAVATTERETASSFYAAEAAVAYGKDWLISRVTGQGAGAWTAVLLSKDVQLCAPGAGSSPGFIDPFSPRETQDFQA